MFTNFSESQKDLFWMVIQELPINFDDSKLEDIAYLEMRIDDGKLLNNENIKTLRHSTLLLRLLKEIKQWQSNDDELDQKKEELVEMLLAAAKRKAEKKNSK